MKRFAAGTFIARLILVSLAALTIASPCLAQSTIGTNENGYPTVSRVIPFGDGTGPKTEAVSWGDATSCGTNGVVASVCGSGANADCGNQPARITCAFTDQIAPSGNPLLWAPYEGEKFYSSTWGERIVCPGVFTGQPDQQSFVLGVCGSGANMDCDGHPNYAVCGGLIYGNNEESPPAGFNGQRTYSVLATDPVWISNPDWGGYASCPEGKVATGFCGSGANKDCNGNVVELQCSTVQFVWTYDQTYTPFPSDEPVYAD